MSDEKTHPDGPITERRRPYDIAAWASRTLIVIAIMLFAAPWSPPTSSQLNDWLCQRGPGSLGPLVRSGTFIVLAAVWRIMLLGVMGGAARWALAPLRWPWWGQAIFVSTLCTVPVIVRWPSWLGIEIVPFAIGMGLWVWLSVRLLCRRPLWALAWFGASGIACAAILVLLSCLLVDSTPRVTDVPAITQQDRTRLEQMLRLAGGQQGEDVELRFNAADLTRIAATWLASRSAQSRISFEGIDDRLRCEVTQPVFAGRERPSYVNVVADLMPSVDAGMAKLGVISLRVGRVSLPVAVVAGASEACTDAFSRTPDAARILSAISHISFSAGELLIVGDPDRASNAFATSMASSPTASDQLRADTREIMQALVAECAALPPGDQRFIGVLRKAFEVAARDATATAAVERNRAALVALGIQLGDPRIRRLAGFPADQKMAAFPWDFDNRTTLKGRNDLVRHFVVSAALRALATRDISMTMGLFKEQLDAVDGGTGFSFTDLAADMAGLRFADNVLDPASAARMQRRIQTDASEEALLPSFEFLSDGLSQVMFARLYGSLTDDRYRMVVWLIDRRMNDCALLSIRQNSDGGSSETRP